MAANRVQDRVQAFLSDLAQEPESPCSLVDLPKEIAKIKRAMDLTEYRGCVYMGVRLSHADMEQILDWIGYFASGNTFNKIPPCGEVGDVLVKLGVCAKKDTLEHRFSK